MIEEPAKLEGDIVQIHKSIFRKQYHTEAYSKCNDKEQWVRLGEGCPNRCEYCYAPKEMLSYAVPIFQRNHVKIMDMNFLASPDLQEKLYLLGTQRLNKKVIHYELICGIDWRLLTQDIAYKLHGYRFHNIRLAWDYGMQQQFKIKDAIEMLKKAGYTSKEISVFMLCNWKISVTECMAKLDLLKVWNVKVNDCWFDNQTFPNINPLYWKINEMVYFRAKCRKHNQIVLFGIDPELKKMEVFGIPPNNKLLGILPTILGHLICSKECLREYGRYCAAKRWNGCQNLTFQEWQKM